MHIAMGMPTETWKICQWLPPKEKLFCILKKTPIVPQLYLGLRSPSTSIRKYFTCMIICRSCTGNCSCYEFVYTTTMSWTEHTVLLQSFTSSGSQHFLSPLPQWDLSLGWGEIESESDHSHLTSTPWPIMTLFINCNPLK